MTASRSFGVLEEKIIEKKFFQIIFISIYLVADEADSKSILFVNSFPT